MPVNPVKPGALTRQGTNLRIEASLSHDEAFEDIAHRPALPARPALKWLADARPVLKSYPARPAAAPELQRRFDTLHRGLQSISDTINALQRQIDDEQISPEERCAFEALQSALSAHNSKLRELLDTASGALEHS